MLQEAYTANDALDDHLNDLLCGDTYVGEGHTHHLLDFINGDLSAGMCLRVSDVVTRSLEEAGFCSFSSCDEHPLNPFVVHDETQHYPNELGYIDLPHLSLGGFGVHVLSCVQDPKKKRSIYTLDFTASQYGYDDFPLVQKIDLDTGEILRRVDDYTSWQSIL